MSPSRETARGNSVSSEISRSVSLLFFSRVCNLHALIHRNVNAEKYPDHETDFSADGSMIIPEGVQWSNYFLCGVKGVFEEVLSAKGNTPPRGFDCLVLGSIPPSAGLSSSSALVVSAALGRPLHVNICHVIYLSSIPFAYQLLCGQMSCKSRKRL